MTDDSQIILTDRDRELLTQRDRVLIAEVIRRLIARDIAKRDLSETYRADVLSIGAMDLAFFADELVHCHDGDNVALAESVAADISYCSYAVGLTAYSPAGEIHEQVRLITGLERIDAALADAPGAIDSSGLPLQSLAKPADAMGYASPLGEQVKRGTEP